jgi:SAM-dependent methyltransferase
MDAHVGHLNYKLYRLIQAYLHPGYAKEKALLLRQFEAHRTRRASGSPPRILELACGLGDLSGIFPIENYLGVDASESRIAVARSENPGRRFEIVDVTSKHFDELIGSSDFIFCHGLLHHLSDTDCLGLIDRVRRHAPRPATFVAMEPVMPERPLLNPLSWLICKMDEGYFIRRTAGYRALFTGESITTEPYDLMPRYPLGMEAYVLPLL